MIFYTSSGVQSTNQPINQSTNQPINQSTNQPMALFEHVSTS
ncbi:hypothetical protein YPC_4156 [Yersinia pestis biovar Medievalis str. Harbin 35]|nr:hypothetical protein YPC_4156 [Yersinia pestis biovar Medievalis str. Harbin 35]EFA47261.1 hypothetical protein YPD27_1484 [Yersinia pestis KIM D27]